MTHLPQGPHRRAQGQPDHQRQHRKQQQQRDQQGTHAGDGDFIAHLGILGHHHAHLVFMTFCGVNAPGTFPRSGIRIAQVATAQWLTRCVPGLGNQGPLFPDLVDRVDVVLAFSAPTAATRAQVALLQLIGVYFVQRLGRQHQRGLLKMSIEQFVDFVPREVPGGPDHQHPDHGQGRQNDGQQAQVDRIAARWPCCACCRG